MPIKWGFILMVIIRMMNPKPIKRLKVLLSNLKVLYYVLLTTISIMILYSYGDD